MNSPKPLLYLNLKTDLFINVKLFSHIFKVFKENVIIVITFYLDTPIKIV